VKKREKAAIKIGALGQQEYFGTIEEIGVVADPLAHTYKVKIGISNKDGSIKPGMVCTAVFHSPDKTRGLVIPSYAVTVDEKGRSFVYAVDPSQEKAKRVYVKTGKLLKDGIEITDGLNAGELVVTAGQQKLADNSLVHIVGK